MRIHCSLWCLLALAAAPAQVVAADTARPNVVFILSDDQNFDTLGCFGGKVLTPHIDRLAAEGVRFTRAYSVSSVCTPSRYICLTGQYASRAINEQFLRGNPPGTQSHVGFNVAITPETPNIGRALKAAGYATGLVGKWHTGGPRIVPYAPDADPRDPKIAKILAENQRRMCAYIESCGFDYAASIYRGNLADHKLDALDVHNMEWVTAGALEFIERYKERPFYLEIAPTLQHGPPPNRSIAGNPRMTPAGLLDEPPRVQAPRETIAPRLKAAGVSEQMGHATWLDDAVGAVVEKLRAAGIAERTVIIFFSDNATRGGKGTCYEGGAHVPALMTWPGRVKPGTTCDKLVGNIDFVPTILDLCGVDAPADMQIDGMSLVPLVTGENVVWREALGLDIGHTRGIVTEKWKYIAVRYKPSIQAQIDAGTLGRPAYHMDGPFDLQETARKRHPAYFDADQLYDLEADAEEQKNLAEAAQHQATLEEMKGRLRANLTKSNRAFAEFSADGSASGPGAGK